MLLFDHNGSCALAVRIKICKKTLLKKDSKVFTCVA